MEKYLMKDKFFLIRKITVVERVNFHEYITEIEVIKDIDGFYLGEKIIQKSVWDPLFYFEGKNGTIRVKNLEYPTSVFITLDDWRDKKLEEILL